MKFLSVLIFSFSLSPLVMAETAPTKEQIKAFQVVGEETNKVSRTGAAYALNMIKDNGKLAPFALIMNNDGSTGKLEAASEFITNAPTSEKIAYLRGQIKHFAEKNKIKAGALFSRGFGRTSSFTEDVAGLIIEMEHRHGASTLQFVPYELKDEKIMALKATSKPKPRLFFNTLISSDETYKSIKKAVQQAEK